MNLKNTKLEGLALRFVVLSLMLTATSTQVAKASIAETSLNQAHLNQALLSKDTLAMAQSDKKIWLERPVIFSDEKGQSQFVAYRQRRSPWGFHVGVSYSFYAPVHYTSDFLNAAAFDQPRWRLFEVLAAARWNSALGSLSIEARGGLLRDSIELIDADGYAPTQPAATPLGSWAASSAGLSAVRPSKTLQNDGTPNPPPPAQPAPPAPPAPDSSSGDDSVISLQLITTSLGLKWSLDSLTREPWVVPFLSAGAFMVFYTEEKGDESVQGRSDVGLYYSGGLLLQLDWLDRDASVDFYLDSGIENTFLMCEVRQFVDLTQNDDLVGPNNFTGPLHFNIGLVVEF